MELHKRLEALEGKIGEGKSKLSELSDAEEEAWESIKDGVEGAWDSLKSGFHDAAEKFKEHEPPADT